ncbi:MAG: hypothetical protein WC613_05740 [Candidatus Aenigmatarchaeota archaeon]
MDRNLTQEYENCWFEIRSQTGRILTRDREDFLRKSETLSRLQEVTLYKIEKTFSGMERSRLFWSGGFPRKKRPVRMV